jgi:hypothetical protein
MIQIHMETYALDLEPIRKDGESLIQFDTATK